MTGNKIFENERSYPIKLFLIFFKVKILQMEQFWLFHILKSQMAFNINTFKFKIE